MKYQLCLSQLPSREPDCKPINFLDDRQGFSQGKSSLPKLHHARPDADCGNVSTPARDPPAGKVI